MNSLRSFSRFLKARTLTTFSVTALVSVLGLCLAMSPLAAADTFTGCGAALGHTTVKELFYPYKSYTEPYYEELGVGSVNTCVKSLQTDLNEFNYGCPPFDTAARLVIDGQFGPLTKAAVEWYQNYTGSGFTVNGAHVSVDGVVGPQTWSVLSLGSCNANDE